MRKLSILALLAAGALAFGVPVAPSAPAWPRGSAAVGYASPEALARALARVPARVVRRVPALHVVEVRPPGDVGAFAAALARRPGIRYVERLSRRESSAEPALGLTPLGTNAYEWQYAATHEDAVDPAVLQAAGSITIAVVDTGADLSAPDLAAKFPATWSVVTRSAAVADLNGHGTLVASLAAGSSSNGEGIAGFGGEARLLVVQAGRADGSFTDVDEARAIVYAVDHGARIVNLSLGGETTSTTERTAIDYAARRGVLLVAAAGNSALAGNVPEYPAALLQPLGSNGDGGRGLAVGASTSDGTHASFSNTGSYLSLAAPGENVFGAFSASAPRYAGLAVALTGSASGVYGYVNGTSFAAPEVAGAAALVWAANPALGAQEVAAILKATASGRGAWTPELGYGVIDVAAAVAQARAGAVRSVLSSAASARAGAALTLAGSRAAGLLDLTATLRPKADGVSAADRTVVLETSDGRTWRLVARSTTGDDGRARWTVALTTGAHRMRARFAGAEDLAAAVSSPVVVRGR